jgi:hypothetical protein
MGTIVLKRFFMSKDKRYILNDARKITEIRVNNRFKKANAMCPGLEQKTVDIQSANTPVYCSVLIAEIRWGPRKLLTL